MATVEIDSVRFKLTLDAEGKPYTLKRWTEGANGVWRTGHPHWATVWAEWHKARPTGIRRRAIAAMGFTWLNDTRQNHGWHHADGRFWPAQPDNSALSPTER